MQKDYKRTFLWMVVEFPWTSLLLALLALGVMVAAPALTFLGMRPGAALTYTLDDAYIHMAISKNLALHGVYGVTAEGFTSSSSSIAWPWLLAGVYKVFGVNEWAPLALNLLFAGLSVWAAWHLIRTAVPGRPWVLLAGTLGLVLFTPLAPLVLSGMETTLQIFLALLFVDAALPFLLESLPSGSRAASVRLVVIGLLFATARYEDLALVSLVCLMLVLVRRSLLAGAVWGAAVLPLLVYGLVSSSQGWLFVPNSILMKSANGMWSNPLMALPYRISQLWSQPHLFFFILAGLGGLLLSLRRPANGSRARDLSAVWLGVLFVLILMVHVGLDHFGYFYRYEAYVIALGWVAVVALWGGRIGQVEWTTSEAKLRTLLGGMVLFAAVMPLYMRGALAQYETPHGMANIYDQHVQMALFVREYYNDRCVAINDIGAVSFYSDACVIDLAGLANRDTARMVMDRQEKEPVIAGVLSDRPVDVIIIYASWFGPYLPPEWQPVGSWTLERRWTVGDPVVTFYAAGEDSAERVRAQLEAFSGKLPEGVAWAKR